MSISKYNCARHNLKSIATGELDVVLTSIADSRDVGVLVDYHQRYSNQSSWYSNEQNRGIGREVMNRVLDKLAPAIQSLFQRYLAEHIEELRVAALAEAEGNLERESTRLAGIVADMEAPFDAPDSEA